MWRTWDLVQALTQYHLGFGANNSRASAISNFRIRSLWAKLSVNKRTSGPHSLKKGNYLHGYYCVMDPVCWRPEKHVVQCTESIQDSSTQCSTVVFFFWKSDILVESKIKTMKKAVNDLYKKYKKIHIVTCVQVLHLLNGFWMYMFCILNIISDWLLVTSEFLLLRLNMSVFGWCAALYCKNIFQHVR